MRVLIDECLPKKLKRELPGHQVMTVQEKGWSSKNGELLRLLQVEFDVFLTADQNLIYQQNLSNTRVAVIVLSVPNNRIEALKPLMAKVQEALKTIQPGEVVNVSG
jgi:predicted nuclease of predicted toxin-antitoxin system